MTCRSCGTEIAANALICYRCGDATSDPRIPPPPPGGRAAVVSWPLVGGLLAAAAGAAYALWTMM